MKPLRDFTGKAYLRLIWSGLPSLGHTQVKFELWALRLNRAVGEEAVTVNH